MPKGWGGYLKGLLRGSGYLRLIFLVGGASSSSTGKGPITSPSLSSLFSDMLLHSMRFTDFWVLQRSIRENKRTSNVLVNLLLKTQGATQTCGYPNTGWRISTCTESDVNSSPLLEDPFKMQSKSNKKHISYIINTIFISSSPIHQKAQVLFTVFFFCFSIKVK